jgi:DNA-binding Xre family transcriptional regulator
MARRSNGEGSFYQQKDKSWVYQVTYGRKEDGSPYMLQELIKEPLVDLGRVSVPTHVVSLAKRRKFQFLIPAVLLYFTRYGGFPNMRISYNKLWKMLIDKNMKKSDLREKAGINSASLAKLGKGDNITTDVLLRICEVMDCRIEDILETVRD